MGSVWRRAEPYILILIVNLWNAGYNIVSKMALDKGFNPFVLLVYSQAFGTVATALLAIFFERMSRPKIDRQIMLNIFFEAVLITSTRVLQYTGLQRTTSTFTTSMASLFPAMTFILALVFGMERLEMRVRSQAKVVGTMVAFGGAILMTLCKGTVLIPAVSGHSPHHRSTHAKGSNDKLSWIIGSLMLLGCAISRAGFYILQSVTIEKYPAPLSLTFLVCIVGTFQAAVITCAMDHKASDWRLAWDIRLIAALYCGIVGFGGSLYVIILVIRKKGPVFSSAFAPSCIIMVAVMDLLILGQSLHIGSALGATLIVGGLYMVLWGKSKDVESASLNGKLPCQMNPHSHGTQNHQ